MENVNPVILIALLVLVGALIAAFRGRTLRKQLIESQKSAVDQMASSAAKAVATDKEHHEIAKQTLIEMQEIKRSLLEIKDNLDEKMK